ncbi:MAG TPA: DNA polymerase III subunit gamma/tau [Chromatiales bacterium]|nr:DNA polymerase III subunit gamma/tau [Chromatiales bacterium]
MSYQVLARKWRPRRFEALVGQEHVVRALVNALRQERLHHAYLFTGTRGVGKTTVARILAKALNCERGITPEPCGECEACREIDEGRFVDLIEVDAASRTKVEDTRELLDNVQYAPTRGRFKVYLIDEVHMLSTHSFNALLKTLEEPPPHVKFLLATTDPQKLPVTVLSRCLQFGLRRLAPEAIAAQLGRILEAEGVPHEAPALALLARAADGSMRDALSLLDQAIAFGGGEVREAEVRAMLGTVDRGRVRGLLERLAAGDGPGLLAACAALDEEGPDYDAVLAELLGLLHRLAVVQTVPEAAAAFEDREALEALARAAAPEDVQLWYQIALQGRRDLPHAADPRGGFEMTLLRMLAFRPVTADLGGAGDGRGAAAVGASGGAAATAPGEPAQAQAAGRQAPAAPRGLEGRDWAEVVAELGLGGAARELAAHCTLAGVEGDTVRLVLDEAGASLRGPGVERRLAAALARHLGREVRLVLEEGRPADETPARRRARAEAERRRAAVEAIRGDETVRSLAERFGARIDPALVEPLDGRETPER